MLKLILIAGARPNFMKVAPLMRAICDYNSSVATAQSAIDVRLVHTGQHYDEAMSEVFFRELGIPAPDINLDVGSWSHAVQTAKVMTSFEPILEKENPDWVVVVGDVNSTLACTLVSAKMGIRVAHVEAGLRSFDRTMPEEINRLATDALADLLLTPSEDANDNLRREGIADSRIRFVGNIMIDSLVQNLAAARRSRILDELEIRPGGYIYATLHRPSNVDSREHLIAIMRELGQIPGDLDIVFPVHPRTKKMLTDYCAPDYATKKIKMISPIGYHDSLYLTEHARLIVTDSGGLQEESTYFRTPCLTLRPNTERPVTITLGSNRLASVGSMSADIQEVLTRENRLGRLPPLWDGNTATRVLDAIIEYQGT